MKGTLFVAAISALFLTACDAFPRDAEGTLATIRNEKIIRVGITRPLPAEGEELLDRIAGKARAKPMLGEDSLEPLLQKLDDGKLDLVIAPFTKATPWATEAALSPPILTENGEEKPIEWRAAMRNGENRWIMLVETEARHIGKEQNR